MGYPTYADEVAASYRESGEYHDDSIDISDVRCECGELSQIELAGLCNSCDPYWFVCHDCGEVNRKLGVQAIGYTVRVERGERVYRCSVCERERATA